MSDDKGSGWSVSFFIGELTEWLEGPSASSLAALFIPLACICTESSYMCTDTRTNTVKQGNIQIFLRLRKAANDFGGV